MENFGKKFISSLVHNLCKQGSELCEEIKVYIELTDELMMEKAETFCNYFISHLPVGVNCNDLYDKCRNYLLNLEKLKEYKRTYNNPIYKTVNSNKTVKSNKINYKMRDPPIE